MQLSERQQLVLAVLLVILVATSMLYCLGLASVALRHSFENSLLPWTTIPIPLEEIDLSVEPFDLAPASTAQAP